MGKQFKPLTETIYDYLLKATLRESPIQAELREITNHEVEFHRMMTSPEQAQFITLLVELMGARRAIEVGVFTGYGTLAIAQALPKEGELIACDIAVDWPNVGKPFWEKAGVDHKIQLKIAPALETLQALIDSNQSNSFDFIYVDADKINYQHYYELSLQLLRQGGMIAFDNMLRVGDAIVAEQTNPATKAIFALNNALQQDSRVNISLVPIAEGVMLVRKR